MANKKGGIIYIPPPPQVIPARRNPVIDTLNGNEDNDDDAER